MSKQLTPMSRLLNDLNAELAGINPNSGNENTYRGTLKNIIRQVTALLPEEKQFAADSFDAGVKLICQKKSPNFDDYYSKFEE